MKVDDVMVRVRLKRTGTRNAVCFRVVVMDQRSSRDGKAIEELGFYNPRTKEESVNVERADYWKSVGAVFSPTVVDVIERVRAGKTLRDVPLILQVLLLKTYDQGYEPSSYLQKFYLLILLPY